MKLIKVPFFSRQMNERTVTQLKSVFGGNGKAAVVVFHAGNSTTFSRFSRMVRGAARFGGARHKSALAFCRNSCPLRCTVLQRVRRSAARRRMLYNALDSSFVHLKFKFVHACVCVWHATFNRASLHSGVKRKKRYFFQVEKYLGNFIRRHI